MEQSILLLVMIEIIAMLLLQITLQVHQQMENFYYGKLQNQIKILTLLQVEVYGKEEMAVVNEQMAVK